MIPFSHIRIGPFDVAVGELIGSDGNNNQGTFDSTDLTIRVHKSYPSMQLAAETVIHEALHAIWHIYGLKAKDGEERVVSVFASALCSLVRDNPKLLNWIEDAFRPTAV